MIDVCLFLPEFKFIELSKEVEPFPVGQLDVQKQVIPTGLVHVKK